MRIVSGQYRGRQFDIPRNFKARPTTDFAKENLFNVLVKYVDWETVSALDLFAGTGSISLELLSRGCVKVVSVEGDRNHATFIKKCVEKLSTDSHVLIRGDVFRFLKNCKQEFDFVFADPPYQLKELATLPAWVLEGEVLSPGGLFVLEHGKDYDFSTHPNFVEHRAYGSVNFSFFKRSV